MDMTMTTSPKFWDGIAKRYAAQPVSDPDAYALTLERTRGYLKSTDHVLEIGCGTGTSALKLADACAKITATDYAPEMIAIAREKGAEVPSVAFELADARLGDFEAGQFDAVLAFNLYHLVDDLETALNRAHAVLKPGGHFITKTPCLGGAWHLRPVIGMMRLFGKAPYLQYLRPDNWDAQIEAAGFDIVETAEHNKQTRGHFVVARKR